ncbi:protein of unknown function UPF0052 and CofD [Alkaliphilus metalliredigens QYMF]|uniref:Putative gluconeogenesis factor n=2 Tax=Alkaliphilus TaxID=114627 RepID=A6TVF4_ALKMQ|nr:protein of unknown function UPF0052 and CofD [Alkaliphilus metalliredigens QYMF]
MTIGIVGILLFASAIAGFVVDIGVELRGWIAILIGGVGVFFVIYSIRSGLASLLRLMDIPNPMTGRMDRSKINKKLHDQRILNRGPKIVVIGGGTGLSVLLRGLKCFTSNITAIVTVGDDGGGSGKLREDLGMLPPGDIRNCILALADMEPTMEKLLQYRFQEGALKGQSFGNLLIAAMNGISENFEDAIKKISEVLAVTGNVLPVTLEDMTLYAKLENGSVIKGESDIPLKSIEQQSAIEQIFIKPKGARALKEAIEAIEQADAIILGPGSLYTSVVPNLLVKEIGETLKNASGLRFYIPNLMTQPGETDDYSLIEHINAVISHCNGLELDYVIANKEGISGFIQEKYYSEGAKFVKVTEVDRQQLKKMNIKLIERDLVDIKKDYVRHDAITLSKIIVDRVLQEKLATDRNRILDYFYIREAIKRNDN